MGFGPKGRARGVWKGIGPALLLALTTCALAGVSAFAAPKPRLSSNGQPSRWSSSATLGGHPALRRRDDVPLRDDRHRSGFAYQLIQKPEGAKPYLSTNSTDGKYCFVSGAGSTASRPSPTRSGGRSPRSTSVITRSGFATASCERTGRSRQAASGRRANTDQRAPPALQSHAWTADKYLKVDQVCYLGCPG
jgi:hypothetical protein